MSCRLPILILAFFVHQQSAPADSPAQPDTLTMQSDVLGEEVKVRVWTPAGYGEGEAMYPVVYCAYSESYSPQAAALLAQLASENELPGVILVSVASNDGQRDFTPTKTENYGETSGGGWRVD